MAEFVVTEVAAGDYAFDSEVLRGALRALRERDRAVEAWLATKSFRQPKRFGMIQAVFI